MPSTIESCSFWLVLVSPATPSVERGKFILKTGKQSVSTFILFQTWSMPLESCSPTYRTLYQLVGVCTFAVPRVEILCTFLTTLLGPYSYPSSKTYYSLIPSNTPGRKERLVKIKKEGKRGFLLVYSLLIKGHWVPWGKSNLCLIRTSPTSCLFSLNHLTNQQKQEPVGRTTTPPLLGLWYFCTLSRVHRIKLSSSGRTTPLTKYPGGK